MKKLLLIPLVIILVFPVILGSCGDSEETTAPTTTTTGPSGPQGELIAALSDFGNENYLPWKATPGAAPLMCCVYEVLIYWDEINREFIPGLAESWEVSPDALTITYHLRQGVQFQDGWGELTSEDVKYNFERHAADDSTGKVEQARRIDSMETPDPYTLVINFKRAFPTFLAELSYGGGGMAQGIVSKNYVEAVGETVAAQEPIGTGPYKLVESSLGSYHKFEALDSHWRVVPEFKTLTVRLVPEISTTVAMLKTGEIDLALVPAEHLADLEASGVNTEVSQVGGSIICVSWGGMGIEADDRYDPEYHNQDPWADPNVRKAMALAINRQAICDAIFAGGATPAGVPLFSADMDQYEIPYDPDTARELLADAGYKDGFSFKAISYVQEGVPEMPRVLEAVVGYWQEIGLDPDIVVSDFSAYANSGRHPLRTAGEISLFRLTEAADMLVRAAIFLMPKGPAVIFMDEGSYAIWQEGYAKVDAEERAEYVEKLNQYYYENWGPTPIVRASFCYAWTDKISEFPHGAMISPYYLEYVRHAEPLDTFRLFTPWSGR